MRFSMMGSAATAKTLHIANSSTVAPEANTTFFMTIHQKGPTR
jgi:hypothetical protein